MTTTIKYGDETIASFSNSKRLLPTMNNYVQRDILVEDVTPPSASVTQDANGYIVLPDTGGGGGGGGGSTANWDDPIRFFDYDGTLVASYSSMPASMPSVPTHTGLTNGTWNYTLQQVTAQFNAMGTCDVGANYDTTSGATEIDIEFVDSARLSPYLRFAVNGTVTIDWGDGSATETQSGTSTSTRQNMQHTYSSVGKYTIKITPNVGTTYSMYGTSTYTLLHNNVSSSNANRVYSTCVKSVRLGVGCTLGSYAFTNCWSLESISIPSTSTVFSGYSFQSCYSLKHVSTPNATSIGNSAFSSCYGLESVSISPTVTTIGSSVFYDCRAIMFISIPSTTTSFGNYAFYDCYAVRSLRLPSGVTSISDNMFYYCFSLTSLTFPANTASIGAGALGSCMGLVSLTIPASVTSIGNSAFSGCYGVKEYHFTRTDSVPTLGTTVFSNIASDCIIYVPSSKLNDYKTAENWSDYADYMVGE